MQLRASGKHHQAETVAADLPQFLNQVDDRRLGGLDPARARVLGQHAPADVEQNEYVAAAPRRIGQLETPTRLHLGERQKADRRDQTRRLDAAPAPIDRADQTLRRAEFDKPRQRLAPAPKAPDIERRQARHQQQQKPKIERAEFHERSRYGSARRRVLTITASNSSNASAANSSAGKPSM